MHLRAPCLRLCIACLIALHTKAMDYIRAIYHPKALRLILLIACLIMLRTHCVMHLTCHLLFVCSRPPSVSFVMHTQAIVCCILRDVFRIIDCIVEAHSPDVTYLAAFPGMIGRWHVFVLSVATSTGPHFLATEILQNCKPTTVSAKPSARCFGFNQRFLSRKAK